MNELPPFKQIKSAIARHPVAVQVKNQLQNESATSKTFLVALSGGPDSVALVVILWSIGLTFEAAHVNYKLRDIESDKDADFCKKLCDQLCITLHMKAIETKKEMNKSSASLQSFARDIRYSFFDDICDNRPITILTAHHLDDSIESFFINILRGTGVDGLGGIPNQRANVYRPFINFKKQEILDFLTAFAIPFRMDSSNVINDYRRNKIRNLLIPVVSEIQPSYHSILHANMKRIQSVAEFLSHEVDSWKHENLQIDGDTWIMKRSSFEPEVQEAFLYHIFKELAVQWSEIKKLKRAIFGEPGKIFQTRTHLILIDRSEITARKKTKIEEFTPIQITKSELLETPSYGLPMGQLLIEMKDNIIDDHSIPGDSIHLDISQLHFPLLIRNWKAGDQFQPNGMKGKHQKISAFLTNQKLSRIEREKVLVLTDSVKILWVIGLRKSHSDILSQENRTGIVRFTLIPK